MRFSINNFYFFVSIDPVIEFVVTTPDGAIYLTSVATFVTVESPFVISAVICVFVVGVNVFNVMSVVNTTVAPLAATLLYFVCVPFNFNSSVFYRHHFHKTL